jgi:hypothetical protein
VESEQDIIKRERAALRQRYGTLFDKIAAILFEADPMGINFETNTDEYEPEAETILLRLGQADTADDVARIVHEEFVRWFSVDDAGAAEAWRACSQRMA